VRRFAAERVAPVAEELDREKRFPYDLVAELAELGLMGMTIPEEYGGGGTDTLSYAIAIEELTRIDSSVAVTVAAHHSLGTLPIYLFGTEEQRRQWLPDLASGRRLAAFGLDGAGGGSDASALRTTAALVDGEWSIDGSKMFITNAGTEITACVTITARTAEDEVSCLIVPNGTPGYDISPPLEKLGWHASDTRSLSFQGRARAGRQPAGRARGRDAAVPADPRRRQDLDRGDGVGLAQGCYDLAAEYARERRQFGRPIASFQAVQQKLVDMATEIEAARQLVYKAAWEKDEGRDFSRTAAMAKLFSGELAPGRELGGPDPRRVRLHGRVRGLASLPRPEDPRDRRGDERGTADGDRPQAGSASRDGVPAVRRR
jgi:alkylation response protein AidB-like acyl-CoA dehydrogenase